MPGQTYERFGLTGNPFRELASESVEDVVILHVNQEVDTTLRTIKEEVFDKENRALVAVTGPLGAGKTERLLLAASEAHERGAFTVFYEVTSHANWALHGLAGELRKTAESAKLARAFGSPAWLRAIVALEKTKGETYDPREAGRAIGAALSERAPSVLLLNDLHNLSDKGDADVFVDLLQEVADTVKPGVLVMFSAYASYLAWLQANHPAFSTRINRTFLLAALSDEEASLLLAKKMLAKRLVEDLDPTFPFDPEAVHLLNQSAGGNPRRLLELADLALEYGVSHRAFRVDGELVRAVLGQRQAAPAGMIVTAGQADRSKSPPSPAIPPPVRGGVPEGRGVVPRDPARPGR